MVFNRNYVSYFIVPDVTKIYELFIVINIKLAKQFVTYGIIYLLHKSLLITLCIKCFTKTSLLYDRGFNFTLLKMSFQ